MDHIEMPMINKSELYSSQTKDYYSPDPKKRQSKMRPVFKSTQFCKFRSLLPTIQKESLIKDHLL